MNDQMKIAKSNRGYTLVEVLISMAIGAIGIMAVMQMQLSALKATNNSQHHTTAEALLQLEAESLQGMPFYVSFFNFPAQLTAGEHSDPTMSSLFTIYWTVTDDTPLAAVPNIITKAGGTVTVSKTITIQVTQNKNGVSQAPAANGSNVQAIGTISKIWLKNVAG